MIIALQIVLTQNMQSGNKGVDKGRLDRKIQFWPGQQKSSQSFLGSQLPALIIFSNVLTAALPVNKLYPNISSRYY